MNRRDCWVRTVSLRKRRLHRSPLECCLCIQSQRPQTIAALLRKYAWIHGGFYTDRETKPVFFFHWRNDPVFGDLKIKSIATNSKQTAPKVCHQAAVLVVKADQDKSATLDQFG